MWRFCQSTGELSQDGTLIATGYSGYGDGRDNPADQDTANVGPIPAGSYLIGPVFDSEAHGPVVMRLTPQPGTNIFGRSGFLIHGDSIFSPGTASHGCIVVPRLARLAIANSHDVNLVVTP